MTNNENGGGCLFEVCAVVFAAACGAAGYILIWHKMMCLMSVGEP